MDEIVTRRPHHSTPQHDGDDVHRLSGVVSFAMTRRAFDHRFVPRNSRLLRRLGNAIDIRAECDHRPG